MSMDQYLGCPKCQGTMTLGFLADQGHGLVIPSRWVKGRPQRSFLTHTKIRDKVIFRVTAYRCESCGYIEMYARERPE